MDEKTFWHVISLLDWKRADDEEALLRRPLKTLASMSKKDICAFAEVLAAKLYALDTRAHAERWHGGDVSADGFLYGRCFVVARGRDFYEEVLADPNQFPVDADLESLLSLVPEAYEERCGEEYDQLTAVSFETFSNKAGWGVERDPGSA